jgi:hypothetical protein
MKMADEALAAARRRLHQAGYLSARPQGSVACSGCRHAQLGLPEGQAGRPEDRWCRLLLARVTVAGGCRMGLVAVATA